MGIAFLDDGYAGLMSGNEFRAFQARRPDPERWELIAGVPIMMVPPKVVHNRIADNFGRLLNDALIRHRPSLIAIPRLGVELGTDTYKPEPDVGVIDVDYGANERFIERVYLLAEVLSSTDTMLVPGLPSKWIDVKREIYLAHEYCEAVVMIEQERFEVRLDLKTANGWQSCRLTDPDAELTLPSFGLTCRVRDLYDSTPLQPRQASS